MSDPSSRRNFLRGKVSTHAAQLRPPWAGAEGEFTALCTRCGDCARTCPTRIIKQGDAGYPTVDFALGECTFCGNCAAACQPQALRRNEETPAWRIRAKIGETCLANRQVECRICGDHCPVTAIRFSPRLGGPPLVEIDANTCNGCGACVAPCPVAALSVY